MLVRRTSEVADRANGIPDPEWVILRTLRPNVLITGTHDALEGIVATLRPYLRQPVYSWSPDTVLPVAHDTATLLMRDVATLPLAQQHALLSWLDQAAGRVQVVSTTTLELFPLVEQGMFLKTLYYRLNTMRLDTQAPAE